MEIYHLPWIITGLLAFIGACLMYLIVLIREVLLEQDRSSTKIEYKIGDLGVHILESNKKLSRICDVTDQTHDETIDVEKRLYSILVLLKSLEGNSATSDNIEEYLRKIYFHLEFGADTYRNKGSE